MNQNINNEKDLASQVNIGTNKGQINFKRNTRFSKRFEKLNTEVISNEKCLDFIHDLEYYLTKLDGDIDMPTKLKDGGFKDSFILEATRRKEFYWKKFEKHKYYESAQWIDTQIFAQIKVTFEAHIEPLINNQSNTTEIKQAVLIHVINPILNLINEEGENDEVLNYNAESIYGMIYFLTGKCHINWKNYDNL